MNSANRQSHVLMLGLSLILAAAIVLVHGGGDPAARAAATTSGSSCYVVVGLDRTAGVVIAKVGATGVTEKFRVSDPKVLAALRVGMVLNIRPSGGTSGSPKPEDCGWNGGRNAQTKTTGPKMCVGHDAQGREITYPCQ